MAVAGVIRQILTHHSYLLLYLTGGVIPHSLCCFKSIIDYQQIKNKEQQASVMLQYPSTREMRQHRLHGTTARFVANWATDDTAGDPWTFVVKVMGTKGGTKFSYRDWVCVSALRQRNLSPVLSHPSPTLSVIRDDA